MTMTITITRTGTVLMTQHMHGHTVSQSAPVEEWSDGQILAFPSGAATHTPDGSVTLPASLHDSVVWDSHPAVAELRRLIAAYLTDGGIPAACEWLESAFACRLILDAGLTRLSARRVIETLCGV